MGDPDQEPGPVDGKGMTEWKGPGFESVLAVARQAGRLAELLDVLWEQDRNEGPPPYVSVSQLRVMYLVDRENGFPMRALTRRLGASPPSVSRLVDRLQALGFVERRPCPDSRREVMLGLTPAGRIHLARVRERRDQLLLHALRSMPGQQRAALAGGLAALQHALVLPHGGEDVPCPDGSLGGPRNPRQGIAPPWTPEGPVLEHTGHDFVAVQIEGSVHPRLEVKVRSAFPEFDLTAHVVVETDLHVVLARRFRVQPVNDHEAVAQIHLAQ
ncbi:MarR family transcriptional regulator [Streptomyces sp. NBC_00647]|uniref:MarR family winged helix-turn-helix transcriptional regulator n=1 Tax=Streptomyces sp. NBC_00647 TaxID=2975796 RepID=UPI003248E936